MVSICIPINCSYLSIKCTNKKYEIYGNMVPIYFNNYDNDQVRWKIHHKRMHIKVEKRQTGCIKWLNLLILMILNTERVHIAGKRKENEKKTSRFQFICNVKHLLTLDQRLYVSPNIDKCCPEVHLFARVIFSRAFSIARDVFPPR